MVKVLQKGENISLNKLIPNLDHIVVVLKWQSANSAAFAIDSSAFLLTQTNKVSSDADFIFYNQPNSAHNAVILKNNAFKIATHQLNHGIDKISFALTIDQADSKKHHFGLLETISIDIFHFATKEKIISYTLSDITIETAVILGVLYRYQNEWKFRAMGQGYTSGLAGLAKLFGVVIDEPEQTAIPNTIKPNIEQTKSQLNDQAHLKQNTQSKPTAPQNTKQADNKAKKQTQANNQADLKQNTQTKSATAQNTKQTDNKTKKQTKTNNQADLKQNTKQPNKKPPVNNSEQSNRNEAKLDIHNTDMMTKQDHYTPIVQWFANKNCKTVVNETATDTSGFFDEVAVMLGDDYALLKIVSDTIKRRQFKGYDRAYIELTHYSDENAEIIKTFCKTLYQYTFIARYFYDDKTKKIILTLQSASKIVNFFNGEWLEWYAMMKIASLCHEQAIPFSCIRNMKVYPDFEQTNYEVDVFFLINQQPIFIECKSGEYRGFIDKYSKLRKKLFINKTFFLMLVAGVDHAQINGLNAMFDITFINESSLPDYLAKHIHSLTTNTEQTISETNGFWHNLKHSIFNR